MKKIYNFLPEKLAIELFNIGNSIFNGSNKNKYNIWTNKVWQKELVHDSSIVICVNLEHEYYIKVIKSLIDNEIISKEDFENQKYDIGAMIYLWTKESYISLHSDKKSNKALTIYLNENWDFVDGGLFLWNDAEKEEWQVIIPKFNLAVLNDENIEHATTPVKSNDKLRITLQIFLSEKEKNNEKK